MFVKEDISDGWTCGRATIGAINWWWKDEWCNGANRFIVYKYPTVFWWADRYAWSSWTCWAFRADRSAWSTRAFRTTRAFRAAWATWS